uniref:Salivary lipocalin n=1 Tax=Triatoma matogrossensis TaxID=162370 RepID=E2J744_9HEMI
MKTIIAVSFFGILTYAYAQASARSQVCQQPTCQPMTNFNPSNFFLGNWFVTHAKNGPDSTLCRMYKTSISRNTITFNGDGYYGERDAEKYYQVRCTGQKNSVRNGKLSLSCKKQQPTLSGTPTNITNFNLELTFIDTDYGQYAIMHRCATYPTLKVTKDNLLILHRARTAIKSNIETILKQKCSNLGLNDFISKPNIECKRLD